MRMPGCPVRRQWMTGVEWIGTRSNDGWTSCVPSTRDLDEVIRHLIETRHSDTMRIQRLKKRKLKLKDTIARLESELIPDLDA